MTKPTTPPKPAAATFQSTLKDLKSSLHGLFPDNQARLVQLDSHLATVAMVVDHLFDEAERN